MQLLNVGEPMTIEVHDVVAESVPTQWLATVNVMGQRAARPV